MADDWSKFPTVGGAEDPWSAFPKADAGKTQSESAVRGLAQGATMGFQDEMAGLGKLSVIPGSQAASQTTLGALSAPDVIAGGIRRLFGGGAKDYEAERNRQRAENEQAQKDNPWTYTGGNVAGAIATAVPTASLAAAPTIGGQIMRGGALGAGYGAIQGTGEAKEITDIPYEVAKGGVIGGAVGGAVPAVLGGVRRALNPAPVAPARQPFVDTLRNEGVELTAGQASGSKPLLWTESTLSDLPFGGGKAFAEQQGEQFVRAAFKKAGVDASRATPEVMAATDAAMGQRFTDLTRNNDIMVGRKLVSDLGATRVNYNSLKGDSARAPIVDDTIQDIIKKVQENNGRIPGPTYQSMRSELSRKAKNASDPDLKIALASIRDALDDAMEVSMRATKSPDVGKFGELRRQYANFMRISDAAGMAGSETAQGVFSPSQLRSVLAANDKRGYVRGRGDLAELARAGEAVMKPLPNSGTAQRTMYGGLLAGGAVSTGPGALMYALAGPAAGRVLLNPRVARALNSPRLQGPASDNTQRLMRALLTAPAAQQITSGSR